MKSFILLFLFSLSAQAACDYTIRDRMMRSPEQQRVFRCELNFRCAERAIRDENSDPAEIEKLVDYSRIHKCNDELRLADLWSTLMEEAPEEDLSVNNSERGNSKADLPVIPDAPEAPADAKTQRQ